MERRQTKKNVLSFRGCPSQSFVFSIGGRRSQEERRYAVCAPNDAVAGFERSLLEQYFFLGGGVRTSLPTPPEKGMQNDDDRCARSNQVFINSLEENLI